MDDRIGSNTMVRIFFLLPLLSVSVGLGGEELTQTVKPPAIKQIIIENNAAKSDVFNSYIPPEPCADFILKKSDVLEFFKVARSATDRQYGHALEMSSCYASGQAVLRNGGNARWEIDRMRRGALWLPDGTTFYFYCGKCQSKKYYEDCDIDCIHGP